MKTHEIKCLPNFFADAITGKKNFTIRYNDRNYKVNDTLIVKEWDRKAYTGRTASFRITYVLTSNDFPKGLVEGFCVLNIESK